MSASLLSTSAPAHSRRDLFRIFGALGIASAAAMRTRPAKAAPPDVSADVDPNSLINKLVRRITFGYSDTEFTAASLLGYTGYLEQQLNPDSIPEDIGLTAHLAALTTLTASPTTLYASTAGTIASQLQEAKIWRAVYSKKQLLERMVDFWTDHFNIDLAIEEEQYIKTVDERSVIRPFALGTFSQLVNASATSPAMLYYLNNDISTKNNPNENYGRELLELHTLSPASGYTQSDVLAVARCFTGWSKYSGNTANGANAGLFRYVDSNHDKNSKTLSPVFDIAHNFTQPVVIPANQGPMVDAQQVINILVQHPATANYIAGKLCRCFLGENTPASIISMVAQVFLATGGDIKSMLRAVLAPNILADAEPRFKRPFHLAVSAMRALPVTLASTSGLSTQFARLGHIPYGWSPPDGYPDTTDYWSGSELPRWSFGASAATNSGASTVSGLSINSAGFFAGLTTAAQHANKVNQSMFGGEMNSVEKTRLQTFFTTITTTSPVQTLANAQKDLLGMAIACPSFQWY